MDQTAVSVGQSQSPARSVLSIWLPRIAILIAIAIAVVFFFRAGLRFRHWMWDTTTPIRFISDIDRGYQWGRECASEGFLNQYEKMQPQQPNDEVWLDYAPLRLGVMALWGRWAGEHYPGIKAWHQIESHAKQSLAEQSYALTAPVLRFSLFMELIGLLAAFLLTRFWAIRNAVAMPNDRTTLRYFFRGCLPGLIAALLLWFNPAIVLSAYGWPTWDLWIIPLFLLAAFFASTDWWFTAGLVIGIGAMFKGQQLLALPVFVIWSLILLRPLASARFLGGAALSMAIITSPWLFTYVPADQLAKAREIQSSYGQAWQMPIGAFKLPRNLDMPALMWTLSIFLGSTLLPLVGWLRLKPRANANRWQNILAWPWAWRGIAAMTTFMLVTWPWLLRRNRHNWEQGFTVAAMLAIAILLIRPRGIAYLAATATAVAMLLCMSVFHGSHAWYDCGLHFGTIHWPMMVMGLTDNLPGIMVSDFNWPIENITSIAATIPAHVLWNCPTHPVELTIGALLHAIFVLSFFVCCVGLGLHARRRDGRMLIALVAPWLMFFSIPPQIHERYLLFAAGISSICAGVSIGMTLLGCFLTLATFVMTLNVMLVRAPEGLRMQLGADLARQFPSLFKNNAGEKLLTFANGTHPDLGYAVLLCGVIFLYFSVALRRRPRTGEL